MIGNGSSGFTCACKIFCAGASLTGSTGITPCWGPETLKTGKLGNKPCVWLAMSIVRFIRIAVGTAVAMNFWAGTVCTGMTSIGAGTSTCGFFLGGKV